MATPIDCNACDSLRENAAEMVANGINTNVCNSLKNNTGYGKKRANCDDVDDANDCLVGRMAQEADAYEVCDWKEYIKKFVGNVHTVIKSLICWLCGLQAKVDKQECKIAYLANGATFHIDRSSGNLIAGEGVEFTDHETARFSITYIAGGLARGQGQIRFHSESWTDSEGTHAGNPVWASTGNTVNGNELIYEVRVKMSDFPQIQTFYAGFGQEANAGGYHVRFTHYSGGYAPGQHGDCDRETGEPSAPGHSRGHYVEPGWVYLQLRMSYIFELIKSGNTEQASSPIYFFGMRMNLDDAC